MWLLFRVALLIGFAAAVRFLRPVEADLLTAGGAIVLLGGPILRWLAPRKSKRVADANVEASRPAGGGAPSRAEYLNAGVDTRTCGKCRRPIRGAAFFFSLDDRPTVYCESCWNLAAPADDPVRRGQWMMRLAGGFERRGA